MSNAIVPFDDVMSIAKAMAASGYFTDSRDANQAIVKILAGQEFGFGPVASMMGIHIIQGRPAMGANLIASKIKNDPRYDYRVVEMTDNNCSIDFFEGGQKIGNSSFSLSDAKKAQTKNLDKFPRNMLFARAISNGARWFTPGIFGGSPVYTPEELGADIDQEGNVIPGTFKEASPESQSEAPRSNGKMSLETAQAITNSKGVRYGDLTRDELATASEYIARALTGEKAKDPEHREELLYKQDAIALLLAQPA